MHQQAKAQALAARLRRALHDLFDGVTNEPMPERWIDLINRLNEEEQAKPQPEQK